MGSRSEQDAWMLRMFGVDVGALAPAAQPGEPLPASPSGHPPHQAARPTASKAASPVSEPLTVVTALTLRRGRRPPNKSPDTGLVADNCWVDAVVLLGSYRPRDGQCGRRRVGSRPSSAN